MTAECVCQLLEQHRFDTSNEDALQRGVEQALSGAGVAFTREARLSETDRVDFLVGRVAVEVKTQGSLSNLLRQLARYTRHDAVEELLVVSTRSQLSGAPSVIDGKPVRVLTLFGSML